MFNFPFLAVSAFILRVTAAISINRKLPRHATTNHTSLNCRRDQNLVSTVNCWYLVLEQTRRESRDHATLSDIYNNNVIVRLAHVGEDVIRLFKKVRAGIKAGEGTQSPGV